MQQQPFLSPSFHIRWSALTADRVEPDITAALGGAGERIAAICARSPGELTFENTFLALEEATEPLATAWGKAGHLESVADTPELRAAYNKMLPQVTAFLARIPLNAELWQRLRAFAESPGARAVQGVRRRFMEETLADFRQAGADLPEEKRTRLESLRAELAQLTQRYSEHVLDATNAWELLIGDEAQLAGLPENAREAARRNAEKKGRGSAAQPAWRFTLHQPSQEPFMTHLENDGLRRQLWEAATAVGAQAPHDNTGLTGRILALRAEEAALLGKKDFADLVLERRMAKSGARALQFIEDMQRRARDGFGRECHELEEFKAAQTGRPRAPLAPWELAFWSEKLRKARHDFDEELLRPYFPLPEVMRGLFEVARRVFGLRVVEAAPGTVETWHPEVKFYEMSDRAGRHVGSFYTDWFPRESKRAGAWMNYLITGGPRPDGSRQPHLGLMCGNLTPPAGDQPALLTHREVETIFHEFGHLIHHLLGEVEIKSLNGVNVAWDFVELPSQIMENWCWERESLDLFARHHGTGEPIPDELFQKMTAAKNFRSACAIMRQVALAKMDLLLHLRATELAGVGDLEAAARASVADCLVPTEPPAPTMLRRFNHIFSEPVGYAAGYYSYKWAEVLDADAFTRFRREGLFNERVGAELVEKILSKGNSDDPMKLYVSFMGREPELRALLVRCGLEGA